MSKDSTTVHDTSVARFKHKPVMMSEVLEALNISENNRFIDCTFGRGGYTRSLLDASPQLKVAAFDRDSEAENEAKAVMLEYPERFKFYPHCFDSIGDLLRPDPEFCGIVWDLGVSSPQIDNPDRGFSFNKDGPLDMRMGGDGLSAEDIISSYDEEDLANIIYNYGQERRSRRVASIICKTRKQERITSTSQLADLVRSVVPRSRDGIDPATRTFQALRIAVNDELGQLERSLDAALPLLKVGGRLAVVSFHSLEDGIVKRFFSERSRVESRNKYRRSPEEEPILKVITKKPLMASRAETLENPRSRSAKLRVAELVRRP